MTRKIPAANIDNLATWAKYKSQLCSSCKGTCCSLPVEVRFDDLARMGVVDPFEAAEAPKRLAKRLQKDGIIERYNHKSELYTLARYSNDDCIYLDQVKRLCTIYEKRPDTCRNHPLVGPKPGYCAYQPK